MAIRKSLGPRLGEIDATVNKIARREVMKSVPEKIRNQFTQGKLTVRHLYDERAYRLKLTLHHISVRDGVSATVTLSLPSITLGADIDLYIKKAGERLGRKIADAMKTFVENNVSPKASRVSNVVKLSTPENLLIFDEASSLNSMTHKENKKPVKKPANDSIYPPWGEK